MAFSLDMTLYLEGSLLREQQLAKVQAVLRETAPRWCSGLHVAEYGQPKRPINVAEPGALAAAVVAAATARGPLYHELKRHSGVEGRERQFGSAELGGADRSLTVVVTVDEDTFRRSGKACSWGNEVSYQVRRRKVEGIDAIRWSRGAFGTTCAALAVAWGNAQDTEEYSAKNISREGGGVMAIGRDVSRALPGLYWLNYFGRPYCDLMGRDRLLAAPAHEVTEVGAGILLMVHSDPLAWNTPEYQEAERRVLDHLGPQYFFSRDAPDRETVAPPFDVPPPPDPSVRLQIYVGETGQARLVHESPSGPSDQ